MPNRLNLLISILLISFLSGCISLPKSAPPPLKLLSVKEIPEFMDDLPKETLIPSLENSIKYFESQAQETSRKSYRVGDILLTPQHMADSLKTFLKLWKEIKNPAELAQRISQDFDVYQSNGKDGLGTVVYSAYYEPTLEASLKKTQEYRFPLYKKPPNLVEAALEDFDASKWKGEKVIGRVQEGKLVPYFNREEIDFEKALSGKELEIAWLKNRFDVVDLHIQGSGRLTFPDGTEMRAKFAATNGLEFKSPGTVLLSSGAIPKDEFTYERAKQYLREHPDIEPWVLARNKRYTFFAITPIEKNQGPLGTMQAPLTAGRSIAIDPKIIPLGTLAFIATKVPIVSEDGNLLGIKPTSRFVLCQDTGGAIQGPGRVDLFVGHGKQAWTTARNLWEQGKLYFFIKKLPPPSR
ncbi:MAG: MltA domain-containing protein [Elusimicrobia bacterium]|nr:MltA domain-containing protein [Elusimicrobiota bacterium]